MENHEPHIEDHSEFGDVLDQIKEYGNWTKGQLVDSLYDESGERESKEYWRSLSRGELLMLVIDRLHGGTFQ